MHHIPGKCGKIYIDRDKTEAKQGCLDEENREFGFSGIAKENQHPMHEKETSVLDHGGG